MVFKAVPPVPKRRFERGLDRDRRRALHLAFGGPALASAGTMAGCFSRRGAHGNDPRESRHRLPMRYRLMARMC
jgi:hypothetical protein